MDPGKCFCYVPASFQPAFAESVDFMVSSVSLMVGMRRLRSLLEPLQALDGKVRVDALGLSDGLQERLAVACVEHLLRL